MKMIINAKFGLVKGMESVLIVLKEMKKVCLSFLNDLEKGEDTGEKHVCFAPS